MDTTGWRIGGPGVPQRSTDTEVLASTWGPDISRFVGSAETFQAWGLVWHCWLWDLGPWWRKRHGSLRVWVSEGPRRVGSVCFGIGSSDLDRVVSGWQDGLDSWRWDWRICYRSGSCCGQGLLEVWSSMNLAFLELEVPGWLGIDFHLSFMVFRVCLLSAETLSGWASLAHCRFRGDLAAGVERSTLGQKEVGQGPPWSRYCSRCRLKGMPAVRSSSSLSSAPSCCCGSLSLSRNISPESSSSTPHGKDIRDHVSAPGSRPCGSPTWFRPRVRAGSCGGSGARGPAESRPRRGRPGTWGQGEWCLPAGVAASAAPSSWPPPGGPQPLGPVRRVIQAPRSGNASLAPHPLPRQVSPTSRGDGDGLQLASGLHVGLVQLLGNKGEWAPALLKQWGDLLRSMQRHRHEACALAPHPQLPFPAERQVL